jgi:hypothetical protein
MTSPQPADVDFSPEHVNHCPMCARMLKEQEAEQGKRCRVCLESFDKRYPFRSEEDETLCNGFYRVAQAPKFPRVGAYGTAAPQRRPGGRVSDETGFGGGSDRGGAA